MFPVFVSSDEFFYLYFPGRGNRWQRPLCVKQAFTERENSWLQSVDKISRRWRELLPRGEQKERREEEGERKKEEKKEEGGEGKPEKIKEKHEVDNMHMHVKKRENKEMEEKQEGETEGTGK